jgi:hypothetical protein
MQIKEASAHCPVAIFQVKRGISRDHPRGKPFRLKVVFGSKNPPKSSKI